MSKPARSLLWGGVAAIVALAVFLGAYFLGVATSTPMLTAQSGPANSSGAEADEMSGPGASSAESDQSGSGESTLAASEAAGNEADSEVAPEAVDAPDFPDLSRRIEGDPAAMGAVDAPVVMIEFADYRCPFCGVYAREMQPQIVKDYVDAGLLRIEWRDTPIFGVESFDAAVAARAAGQQGLFWDYYNGLFSYEGTGHQSLPRKRLLEIAEEIGVPDMAAFEAALDDDTLSEQVGVDYAESQSVGVYSTPAFLVGGTPILGAQPYDVFVEAIEQELDAAGVTR